MSKDWQLAYVRNEDGPGNWRFEKGIGGHDGHYRCFFFDRIKRLSWGVNVKPGWSVPTRTGKRRSRGEVPLILRKNGGERAEKNWSKGPSKLTRVGGGPRDSVRGPSGGVCGKKATSPEKSQEAGRQGLVKGRGEVLLEERINGRVRESQTRVLDRNTQLKVTPGP